MGISAVFKPIKNCAFCTNSNIYNCFKIIKKCSSYNDLLITKALLIKKLQPNFNNQLGSDKGLRVTINLFK